MPAQTTGHFTSARWDERPVGPAEANPTLTRASVTNTFSGGIEAADTVCEYVIVYVGEKTGRFLGTEVVVGRVDGRAGTFAVEQRGQFDADGTLRGTLAVVPDSGTGDLAGLRGTGHFATREGDPSVPYTFDYELG